MPLKLHGAEPATLSPYPQPRRVCPVTKPTSSLKATQPRWEKTVHWAGLICSRPRPWAVAGPWLGHAVGSHPGLCRPTHLPLLSPEAPAPRRPRGAECPPGWWSAAAHAAQAPPPLPPAGPPPLPPRRWRLAAQAARASQGCPALLLGCRWPLPPCPPPGQPWWQRSPPGLPHRSARLQGPKGRGGGEGVSMLGLGCGRSGRAERGAASPAAAGLGKGSWRWVCAWAAAA